MAPPGASLPRGTARRAQHRHQCRQLADDAVQALNALAAARPGRPLRIPAVSHETNLAAARPAQLQSYSRL
eukprot:86178-Lingulodinium_polyedra.AAC.1